MVIDSSALVAILQNEPESRFFRDLIRGDAVRLLSTATFVEASIVALARRGERGVDDLHAFLDLRSVDIVPVTADHAGRALNAFRRFGKGRHPASLNFGDCLSYALAQATSQPLLFKGEDFSRTDIRRAA